MLKRIILPIFLTMALGATSVYASGPQKGTGLVRASGGEVSTISQLRKATTIKPISIKTTGRTLSIESPENQILPIYCYSGTLYCTFKLLKGRNIINGLPRGSYLINNKKYVVT